MGYYTTSNNSSGTAQDIRIWNIDFDSGSPFSSFGINEFDSVASDIEGICVDPWDFTLWLVSDGASSFNLYHLERDGSVIQVFGLAQFGLISPQDVCIDPVLNRIIILDNVLNSLYFFDLNMNFINSFVIDKLDSVPTSLQSISYDPTNGLYWITYYQPEDWIVLIDRERRPLHKFSNTNYTNISNANPTSIAVVM